MAGLGDTGQVAALLAPAEGRQAGSVAGASHTAEGAAAGAEQEGLTRAARPLGHTGSPAPSRTQGQAWS